jgi:hypothetical protein
MKDDVMVGEDVNIIEIESIEVGCKIQGVTVGDDVEKCR